MGARDVLNSIRNWMSRLRGAVMLNRLLGAALLSLAGLLAVSLLIMLLESLGNFSGAVRAVLLVLWSLSALAALGMGIVWPLLRSTVFYEGDEKLAGEYARAMPTIRDRVLNALQLLQRSESAERDGYSADMILEAGRQVAEDLVPIDPRRLPDKKQVKLGGRAALIASAAAVLLFAVAGGSLLSAADRVMKPGREFEPPAPFSLSLTPGNAELVRGDSLVVVVSAAGEAPASITLERQERGKPASEPVTLRGDSGSYRYIYRTVSSSFSYWAHEGRVKTETYEVTVDELPAVRYMLLKIAPPEYTGLPEQNLDENVGDVSAVIGTRVTMQFVCTKPISAARLEFLKPENAGTEREILTSMRAAKTWGTKGNADFIVETNGYYRIRLTDSEGRENRDAILYRVAARPDESPVVTLAQPARDLEIAANVKVPVVAEAMDDFGFTRMAIRYHRTSALEAQGEADESQYKTLPLSFRVPEPGRALGEMEWDLSDLDLLPEDQVSFFVEAWDNDRIHGPKRGKSETRLMRFPSMTEMFEKQEQQAQARQITLADLLKESQEMREKVDEAVEELKSNPEMSWERKQEIEKLMQKQQAMNDLLSQVSQAMQQATEQMSQRAMFSPDVMDKIQKVQQLVQEVITPEMREALRKLSEAMKQPSQEEMRKAMENFKMTQEMFEQALDQAINVLEQLKMEKKLDELTRRLDELGRRQEQLNEKMDQNTPQTAQKNAEEQKKLSEEMKKIEQEMKQLAEQMQEKQNKGSEQMQQLQKQAEQEKLSEQMKQNSENMNMCQNQSAKKKGRQARRKMSEFANTMQNIKQQMQQDENAEIQEALDRARDQLLDLSMRQEQLWKQAENLDPASPQMSETAEEQENLRQALSRVNQDLLDLARQSMFVTPSLMGAMHESLKQMQSACNAAAERDPRTASHYRKQSLAALNSALKENSQACSQCKSQCNKPNPNSTCNKAGQMASQQQSLKEQSQNMMSSCQNPGTLTMGEQASMQRLSQEQSGLAKSIKELAQEQAASQQSLGNLEDAAKEAEEAAKDLENRNVTERTLQKQEHIESRLLDFQRANREREFSPRRQSTTGVDVVRSSPPELPGKPGEDQLRQDLLRALDSKYTPDYEDLIRKYFDALSKMK